MSYEELISAIENDAERERQKIIEDATVDAEKIINDAENSLKELRKNKTAELKSIFEKERNRAVDHLKKEADTLSITAKIEVLSGLFQEVEKRISELKKENLYSDILKGLFKESVENGMGEIGAGKFIVYVFEEDLPLLKNISDGIEVNTDRNMTEGVILISRDNRFRMVNTLKSRMERAKADMLPVLNEILFENK